MTSRASRAPDRPLPVDIAKPSFRNELRRLSLRCRARVVMKRVPTGELSTPPRNPRRFVVNRLAGRAAPRAGSGYGQRVRARSARACLDSRFQPRRRRVDRNLRGSDRVPAIRRWNSLTLCLTGVFRFTCRMQSGCRAEPSRFGSGPLDSDRELSESLVNGSARFNRWGCRRSPFPPVGERA